MKKIKILSFIALLVVSGLVSAAFIIIKSDKAALANNGDKGFAVVELFTSEGCSSCPAADAVVAKIEKESANKPVYILAYHVDYWNRLGWKDVFSSADYSRRQNMYANWLNLSSVYTPQVIVNGKTEFVGSQEGTLRNAIRNSLQKEPGSTLTLTNLKTGNNLLTLNYNINNTANNTLLIALIQKTATTVVKKGENGGRTLSHVQIVNNIQEIPLTSTTGEAKVTLPPSFSAHNYEVIAFLQNVKNGEIIAATRYAFPAGVMANN
ncbi:DUF1223 domain-containing protein [Mucilaginibacter sp.]|jgi:hypothetical protein|uniref:DUF1223 domain-containing protein n=1 Tax=Mucilaginibacter sp. TaxID=1882438 RepID=UPI0035646444